MTREDAAPEDQGLADDGAARDRAREDLDASLVLEAGAGTGKTALLTDRFLNLIGRRGVPIERIVAITFTEKAAAELKVRLREELERRVAQPPHEVAPVERSRYRAALENLALANVSTIHAFAGSLLRERPVEAGVDPGFEQLDAVRERLLFDETWARWEEAELVARAEPYRRVLALGFTRDRVRYLAVALHVNRELLPAALADAGPRGTFEEGMADLAREAEALADASRAACRVKGDRLFALIFDEVGKVRDLAARPRAEQEALLLGGFRLTSGRNLGQRANWSPGAVLEARAGLKALCERTADVAARLGAALVCDLARWLEGFLAALADEKARRGVLDFHDLLLFARDLVRDHPSVRRDFQARFAAILVDEFQDTDPLQTELLFCLAGEDGAAGSWDEMRIGAGKLFIVGDPKQSIYRFRRADIDVYNAVRDRLACGEPLRITRNFRSVPGLIAWANRLFAGLFAPSEEALSQAEFAPILPNREALGAEEAPITLLSPPHGAREGLSMPEVRRLEARAVASFLAAEIAGGRMRARDVAILFRAMTEVVVYEDALAERGIEFHVEGGRTYFQRAEVQALLTCLTAVDDPEDPVALVGALRSAHFGISDDELALLAASGRPFRYLDDPGAEHAAIAESFERLRALHAGRHDAPLHRVVERILEETFALEFHALRGGGRRAIANLRRVAEKARAFEAAGAGTPRGFIRWLRDEEEAAQESDSPSAEPADDLATIMTVHKAKGLEFPVVVLANLGACPPFRDTLLVESRERRLAFSLRGKTDPCRTGNFDDVRAREVKRRVAEERRILYVAITRARDRLVIPGYAALLAAGEEFSDAVRAGASWNEARSGGAGGKSPFAEVLRGLPPREAWIDGAVADGIRVAVVPDASAVVETSSAAARAPRPDRRLLDEDAWREERRRTIAAGRPRMRIVTSRRLSGEPSLAARGGVPGEAARLASAEERRALGRFVHAVLEEVPALDPRRLEEAASAVAERLAFDGDRAEALALARAILDDPVLGRARRAPRVFRELPFAALLDGRLAEGVVDLVFEEGGALVVADYKTERVPKASTGDRGLREHADERGHVDQMALYARALHAATGRPVREGALVYARAGARLSLSGEELLARPLPDPFPEAGDAGG